MKLRNIFILGTILTLFTSCSNTNEQSTSVIKIAGSTSVAPVIKNIKILFEEKYDNISLEIQETGSSAGISSVVEKVADIGMSSRELKGDELNNKLKEVIIAYDGISIVVNPANKVSNITKEDVKKIFTGEIYNWSQIGGIDKEIIVLSREEGSGTRAAFEELLDLEKDVERNGKHYKASLVTLDALYQNSTGAIKKYISTNDNAIGYVSFGNMDETIKSLNINNVVPNEENVLNNTYKISRPFIFCMDDNDNKETITKLVDFILSDEGQEIVSKSNYIKVH